MKIFTSIILFLLIFVSNSSFSQDSLNFKNSKSPATATILSAVLPGAGQFYNESYWKIGVIAGLGGYFTYEIIRSNNDVSNYSNQYNNTITPENPQGDIRLKNLRDFYVDQRDRFYIYAGILYIVQLVDAYVDAELYDFNVTDNIKFSVGKSKRNFMELKVGF
ncbi:MAG TPA: DUF5683 domain-containing protein [Ignavibacteria bacterium]|nr:DUF5683 domain-containing protein [Ignavibacteria bacterium]